MTKQTVTHLIFNGSIVHALGSRQELMELFTQPRTWYEFKAVSPNGRVIDVAVPSTQLPMIAEDHAMDVPEPGTPTALADEFPQYDGSEETHVTL